MTDVDLPREPKTPAGGSDPGSAPAGGASANGAEGAPPQDHERPGGLLSQVDGHVVMYHEPHGLQAEQYRACRTNLTALNRAGAPWALVVTSSKRGEGKSITAANLAACLAELPGTRVCLLDLDSRSPGLGELLGVRKDRGVTELIRGEALLAEVSVSTVIPNLDLVTAGEEPDNPAELLGSDQFVQLIDELRRRYSWIILDAPPVHPWTDACVVSALVNGALVVVRLQDTPRNTVNLTLQNIRSAGGSVIGTFLTGLIPDRDDGSHYDYGRYDMPASHGYEEDEGGLAKMREKAEKRLRRQERALLKKRSKQARKESDDESPV